MATAALTIEPYGAAVPHFDRTDEQYNWVCKQHASHLRLNLQDLINQHDFKHRRVLGTYRSLTPLGMREWQDLWLADVDAHIERAFAALRRAHERHDTQVAA
jgi:hypothetical protein